MATQGNDETPSMGASLEQAAMSFHRRGSIDERGRSTDRGRDETAGSVLGGRPRGSRVGRSSSQGRSASRDEMRAPYELRSSRRKGNASTIIDPPDPTIRQWTYEAYLQSVALVAGRNTSPFEIVGSALQTDIGESQERGGRGSTAAGRNAGISASDRDDVPEEPEANPRRIGKNKMQGISRIQQARGVSDDPRDCEGHRDLVDGSAHGGRPSRPHESSTIFGDEAAREPGREGARRAPADARVDPSPDRGIAAQRGARGDPSRTSDRQISDSTNNSIS